MDYILNMKKIVEKISLFENQTLESFDWQQYITREIYNKFNTIKFPVFWIIWLRWVGKTTYLLSQRKKEQKAVYISCDWNFLSGINFVELILYYKQNYDINSFFLDEIQFLENWDNFLKNLYDLGNIKIIFSGSSKIKIEKTWYDLSRRIFIQTLPIFSYWEFIQIKYGKQISFSFEELIKNHKQLSFEFSKYYTKDVDKETYLKYWEFWYFYQWFEKEFNFLLWNSLKKSIYEDIPQIAKLDAKNLNKLANILVYICNMGSSNISINAISNKIWLDNKIIKLYLEYLELIWWITLVSKYGNLSDSIRKDVKFYLISNNLMYHLNIKEDKDFIWKIRETFFLQNINNILNKNDWIKFKSRTDFVVFRNWKEYEFEIWWKNKSKNDVFTVKDKILNSEWNNIPLWLFWFLK